MEQFKEFHLNYIKTCKEIKRQSGKCADISCMNCPILYCPTDGNYVRKRLHLALEYLILYKNE